MLGSGSWSVVSSSMKLKEVKDDEGIEDEFGVEGVIKRRGRWELSWKLPGRDECWENVRRGLGVYEKQGGGG